MILDEPHYSKKEHFRGSSVTTDEMLGDLLQFEMLPMFGHMVKYSPNMVWQTFRIFYTFM